MRTSGVLYCLNLEASLVLGWTLQRLGPWYPPSICSLHKTLGKAAEMFGSGDKSIRGKTPNLFPRPANVPLTLPSGKWEEGEGENKMKKEIQEKVSFSK